MMMEGLPWLKHQHAATATGLRFTHSNYLLVSFNFKKIESAPWSQFSYCPFLRAYPYLCH